jgi:murein biosynthesis integral membrane protein MurJ
VASAGSTVPAAAEAVLPDSPAPRRTAAGTLLRSALSVGAMRGVDFLLSFLVSVLIAGRFGATAQIDSFFLARRATIGLGDTIRNLVSTVVMPSIVARQEQGQAITARSLPRRVYLFIGGLLLFTLAGMLAPSAIVTVFAPGFDAGRHDLAARLMTILLPLMPIAVVGSLLMAVLQANRRFMSAELSKLLQRALLVLVLAFAIPPLGIMSAAWTMLIAGVLGLGLLLSASWRTIRAHPEALLPHKSSDAETGRLAMGGGVLAAILLHFYHQMTTVIDFAAASALDEGSVAALEYGSRLVSLLPGLVTASLWVVIHPEIVRALRDPDGASGAAKIAEYQRLGLLVQLPVSIGLMLAAFPIVDLIFGHGAFDKESVATTGQVTAGYAAAAIFLMPFNVTTMAIYADPRRPCLKEMAVLATLGLALRGGLVLLFARLWGETGIAWGAALATLGALLISMTLTARRLPDMDMKRQAADFARIGLCGVVAGAAAYAASAAMGRGGSAWDVASIAVIGSVTLAVYVGAALALRVPEMGTAGRIFAAKLPRRKRTA